MTVVVKAVVPVVVVVAAPVVDNVVSVVVAGVVVVVVLTPVQPWMVNPTILVVAVFDIRTPTLVTADVNDGGTIMV